MDRNRHLQRWILAMVTLVTSLVGMAVALTPDGLALMEFKDSFNVTSPLLQNWNPLDTSPCSRGGINCTESGGVRSIILSAQDPMLEGNISSSLGRLKSLKVLMLDQSGSSPPKLGNLISLVTLLLSRNRLSGEIPPQLGTCRSLMDLELDSDILSGTIPESLGNVKNLSTVYLSESFLSGEIPVSLAALPKLITFNVGNNLLTGSVPPVIYKNLNLIEYSVGGNRLSRDLTTGMTRFQSARQKHFKLHVVGVIISSKFSPCAVLEELSRLPAIRLIYLGNNSYNGTLPPAIGNATTLIYLELRLQSEGGFGGQIPKELGKLVHLTELDLWQNNFSGEIPPELGNMTSLESIVLQNNTLTGTIPSSLGRLVNLTFLDLRVNNIMGEIPLELGNLSL